MIGIYAIVCNKTWRSYVGQSSNLEKRKRQHFSTLKRGKSINKELQKDFDIYGSNSFSFEIIEYTSIEELGAREKYWINFGENLYNQIKRELKINLTEKDRIKLWSYIDIKDEDSCWNWNGCRSSFGHGNITIFLYGKNINYKAHRLVYFDKYQDINQNTIVRHLCDNPQCCNPKHLIHGSFQDNARDRQNNKNYQYKITLNDVKIIREKFKTCPNILPSDLQNWFYLQTNKRISKTYLIDICLNKNFVDNQYIPPYRDANKIKLYMVNRIRELLKSNISYTQIIKIFDSEFGFSISKTTITNIKQGTRYKDTHNA